jgi:uncharacterized cysteine cluster protein YcgN (CxxCxxCC family)
MSDLPFWKTKTLESLDDSEWESLCDGCGRCCLVKLEEDPEDEDQSPVEGLRTTRARRPDTLAPGEANPRVFFTDVGCTLLDGQSCRCSDYANRQAKVADCVRLTPEAVRRIGWLPETCGYRLVAEGRDLYWWHPLVSGDPETVHAAGVSVRGRVPLLEDDIAPEDLIDRLVDWPLKVPKKARGLRRPEE